MDNISNELPRCPYCGYDNDDGAVREWMSGNQTIQDWECSKCGHLFDIEPEFYITYSTFKRKGD